MHYSGRERFERFLDDLREGDVYSHWPGRTITEAANEAFCLLTMNHQPLHLDAEYAKGTQHGKPLVNGLLVLSTAVGMSVPDLSGATIANLDYEVVTHHAPVFIGDTMYAETTVLNVRESASRPDRGIVQVETKVSNQRGEMVLSFRRRFMTPKRPAKA